MFARDIIVGQSYRVSRGRFNGRALVTGPGVKDRFDNKFHFPVEFPDAHPSLKNRTASFGSRDFDQLWTMDDQLQFEKVRQEQAQIDALETALIAADFEPDSLRYITKGSLFLTFRGEVADRVVATLLESVGNAETVKQLTEAVNELETHGPHDED
jgi:hypothetical protein